MRTAVFVSGRGSNIKALLDENPLSQFYLFSNKKNEPDAFKWARKRGVYTECVRLQDADDWSSFADRLGALGLATIYLLGFMKIVPEFFLTKLRSESVNLHPSLLPDFPGLNSIEKSFAEQKSMGCTVHKVSAEVDEGEIFLQKKISFPCLDLKNFEQQVHQAEQDTVLKQFDRSLQPMGTCPL